MTQIDKTRKNQKIRLCCLILAAFLLLPSLVFTGCGKTGTSNREIVRIVTTGFAEYDWVRQIVGDTPDVDVSFLLDTGVDLHSFQPTVEDMAKIAVCDLFVYVGGESDAWVADALKTAPDTLRSLRLLDVLGDSAKEEEVREGMETEAEGNEEGEDSPEIDEHIWLSLKNAVKCCRAICDTLTEIDASHAEAYRADTESYVASLQALDADYQAAVDSAQNKVLLFADRFPFRYLTDDYGLDYYAAFVGCSAESEASFETVAFLANKADELSLRYVICLEGSDQALANTVIANTESKTLGILTMNSLQATTREDAAQGVTYLSVMRANLSALQEALHEGDMPCC